MNWCIEPCKYLVPDQSLARAYDITGEQKRAGMKQLIAWLVDFYRINPCLRQTGSAEFKSGFKAWVQKAPVQELVFYIPPGYSSWNRLLAAVIPAVTAGVSSLACVMDLTPGSEPDPGVLAALELAGIENIFLLRDDFSFDDFSKQPVPGGMICVSLDSWPRAALDIWPESAEMRGLGPEAPLKGLIWLEPGLDWDFDLILQSHPGVGFTVSGPAGFKVPEGLAMSAEPPDLVLSRP